MWSNPTSSPTGYGSGVYGSVSSGRSEANPLAQEPCRFFLSGGCLRGDACPYLHEFPDDRHLDVNGVGFIFNSNVKNSSAALQRNYQPPNQAVPGGMPSHAAAGQPTAPPAYVQASGPALHKSPQPQPSPTPSSALGASRSVGSAHAQPFVPQQPTAVFQQASTLGPAGQPGLPPFQATAGIYTYSGQPTPMHAIPQARPQPNQAAPTMYAMPVGAQPQVSHLQTVTSTSGIGAITIVTRQDPGPYAPPMALPYALPPHLGFAFEQGGMTPIPVVYTFGNYSPEAHHAAAMATLIPTAVSSSS